MAALGYGRMELLIFGGRQVLTRCVGAVLRVVYNVRVKEMLGGLLAGHLAGMLGGSL